MPTLEQKFERSRQRLKVLERLAEDSNVPSEQQRMARAQKAAVNLGAKAALHAAPPHKPH